MRVIEVLFQEGRYVKLTVEMPDPDRYTTDKAPHLPRLLFKMFPHLDEHQCDNSKGYPFRRECRATEIPHLLEHLIIELQGQAMPHRKLSGETQWNWQVDPRGRFHVYVEYENELLVHGAIRLAEKVINSIDNREMALIDLPAELVKLRVLAQLGEGNKHESFPMISMPLNA